MADNGNGSKVSVKTVWVIVSAAVSMVTLAVGTFAGRSLASTEVQKLRSETVLAIAKVEVVTAQHSERIRDLETSRAVMMEKFIGVTEALNEMKKQLEEIKALLREASRGST